MGLSRRQREKRAYSLTLVSGGAAATSVVLFVLAVVGVMSLGPAILAAIVAVGAGLLLRNTLRP